MRAFLSSLLALAASSVTLVSAVAFTDPALNATVAKGAGYDLSWSTVDTDPDTFSIYLVNFVTWPPYYTPLALDVETAAGEATVYVPCDIADTYGWQFNAINGTNVYVIYAQTPKFSVVGADCTDPTPSVSTCAAPITATVTVTVSTTLSAARNGTALATTVAPTAVASTSSHPTLGASCPDTIGWGKSGYSYPVTLTKVPTAPGGAVAAAAAAAATTAPNVNLAMSATGSTVRVVYTTVFQDLSEAPGSCGC